MSIEDIMSHIRKMNKAARKAEGEGFHVYDSKIWRLSEHGVWVPVCSIEEYDENMD